MNKLSVEESERAVEIGARALALGPNKRLAGWALAMADEVLRAVCEDFDLSPMDPGPRDDIASGEVWGCVHCFDTSHTSEDHERLLTERIKAEMRWS